MAAHVSAIVYTVFPHIVSPETFSFLNLEIVANLNSCNNISSLLVFPAETIQGRKLFQGRNNMRKYDIWNYHIKKCFILDFEAI